MENLDVRIAVKDAGVKFKEIAKHMGITSIYLSRIMSRPLNSRNWVRIMKAIDELRKEQ